MVNLSRVLADAWRYKADTNPFNTSAIDMDATDAIARLRENRELVRATIMDPMTFLDIVNHDVQCTDCHFECLSASCAQFFRSVRFKRCTFQYCIFYATYFYQGLVITDCEFKTRVNFQSGGHNAKESVFMIKDTVFHDFADFEDCWFTGPVTIDKVEFRSDTNLLGNAETAMQVTFDYAPIIENTQGSLDTNTYIRNAK